MRLVAIVLVLGLAATARADDDLAEAIRLEAALDYDQALAVVTRIIEHGTATDPTQLAELHFYAGRLAAGLDRTDEARDHFARALALKPDLSLPPGTSPKLLAPFEQAHATTVALRVHATQEHETVSIVPDADALAIVAGIKVDGHRHAGLAVATWGGAKRDLRALDVHGNVVWIGDVHALVAPPPRVTPRVARWSTWGIAAGGAAIVGGLCAWRFEVAQDDWNQASQDGRHDYTQLRAIEQRGERWGLAADIGLGVAAAAGVTALVLRAFQAEPRVTPTASGRSVGVAVAF